MSKMTVKSKQPVKAKPGQLLRTHIEYGEGDTASVHHEHEPTPPKPGMMHGPMEMMSDRMATPLKKHFGSRAEALHHAAQTAGVSTTMSEDSPEPDDERDEEDEDAGAGVGDLGNQRMATRKKVFRDQSPNV